MEKMPLDMVKRLYMRFATIYGEKFTRSHPTPEFVEMWWEDWAESLGATSPHHIKTALDYCRENLEWPPSLAEFRRLCETASGVPDVSEALRLAIRKEFNHPVIAKAWDKVGSWSMSHDKESEVKKKFEAAYNEALSDYRKAPADAWAQLEQFKEKIALPPLPEPVSAAEFISWRERLAQYQKRAAEDKAKLPNMEHPKWDKDKLVKGSPLYDEIVFNERKKYLLELDEWLAGTLDPVDWYDRVCYFREIEARNYIQEIRYREEAKSDRSTESEFRRSSGGARRAGSYYGD